MTGYRSVWLRYCCFIIVTMKASCHTSKLVPDDDENIEHNDKKREIAEGPMFDDLPLIMRKYSIPSPPMRSADSVPEPSSAMEIILTRNQHLIEANVPGLMEGDIYLGPQKLRAGIAAEDRRWPNGIVPYVIDGYYDQAAVTTIENAMADYHRYTCIRFVPRTNEADYVFITPLDGCWSGFGYANMGMQKVSLGNGCVWHRTVIHELMHLVGFIHEQGRLDRDQYVRLYEENMLEGYSPQFGKVLSKVTTQGTPYDYDSVMHYDRKAFTKNGLPTIVAIDDYNRELGTARTFTLWDFIEVNGLYDCGYDVDVWYENQKECIIETNTDRRGGNINDGNQNKMYSIEACCELCQSTPDCKSFSLDKRPGSTFGNCWLKNDWVQAWTDDCCDSGIIWPWPEEDDEEEEEDDGDNEGGGGGEEDCVDKNESCEAWALLGECEKNSAYMIPNCAKSCLPECEQHIECVDKNEQCSAWASTGECDKNPNYMKPNCKKSCGVCTDSCLDGDDNCARWASNGECDKNPGWMLKNCKKSCNQCEDESVQQLREFGMKTGMQWGTFMTYLDHN
ncbi:zinc metalloproteinase nas-13-like isoform X2 [Ptychodera flava]|uniref:zinc metalloproteinase nas-13-like isoform X2 n=1 Tax=Ptychodera flava TaxID=63121 RepID=UPI003969EDE2